MFNNVHFCLIFMVKLVFPIKTLGLHKEQENELFGTGLGQEFQPVSLIFFSFRIILRLFYLLFNLETEYQNLRQLPDHFSPTSG